ncbi:hypothetical protein ES707_00508 [subsurface metagenome]
MPERGFQTETWHDDWFQELSWEQKYLFIYLWTNSHCNQAGLYQITLLTMAFETKITNEALPQLLKSLSPKVEWFPEHNLIWVRNFLRHQTKSSKFVVAAIKSLNNTNIPEDIRAEFEFYNQNLLRGVAPSEHISLTKRECVLIRDSFHCQYCGKEIMEAADYQMDHIIPVSKGGKDNYLNLAASCLSCNQKKLDRTPSEAGLDEPHPSTFHGAQATYILRNDESIRTKWVEVFTERAAVVDSILGNIEQHQSTLSNVDLGYSSKANASALPSSKPDAGGVEVVKGKGGLPAEESDIIKRFSQLKGWQADEDDVHWLQGLRSEFPGFTLSELKACVDYYSGRAPPKHKGIWKNRFRNWMIKKREFELKAGRGELPTTKELKEGWKQK